ncbi:MAG: hypothetical protein ABI378_03645 [Chitinophagaceae bacterium]
MNDFIIDNNPASMWPKPAPSLLFEREKTNDFIIDNAPATMTRKPARSLLAGEQRNPYFCRID